MPAGLSRRPRRQLARIGPGTLFISGWRPLRDGAGAPQRIGWFRFYFDDGRWEWSPQVEKMHGYLPGTVTPTTEMVLAYKHPDDYRRIADTLDLIRQTRQPFSSRHRIIDVQGRIHHVVVVGDLLCEADRTVIGTHGYYVDITPSEREHQDQVTAAVAVIAESRAAIERTKGHVDADLRHG
jgi:PAS fold